MPPYQARIQFPPWVPDLSDQESNTSLNVKNALPRADGWGPFPSFLQFTQNIPGGKCFGFVYARNPDGSVQIFAGNATKLYALNNNTLGWVDVSLGGGSYAALSFGSLWQFEQFGAQLLATQGNAALQTITLPITLGVSAFANLGGSPPNSAYIAIINRFVVLSGMPATPYRIQWCDLDNITQWTAGVGLADFQDLPDGGVTQGVAGFDLYGVIFQSSMARQMTFAPGSPEIFTIAKITGGDGNGLFAPYAWVIDQDNVFWLSTEGLKRMPPGQAPDAVGKEQVDRYIFSNIDDSALGLVQFTTEPQASRLYVTFKSKTGQAGLFDTVIVFDWILRRYALLNLVGQFFDTSAIPGATLEGMDAVTPGVVGITGFSQGASNGAGGNFVRVAVTSTAGMGTAAQQATFGVWNLTLVNNLMVGNCNAALSASINNVQNNANSSWGQWAITVIDGQHVDLNGSLWNPASTYTSGGQLGGNIELIPFSFDTVALGSIPWLTMVNAAGAMGTFNGPNTEATIETAEYGSNEKRVFVKGFRVITDSPSVFGSVSYRDNPQAAYKYTNEISIDQTGTCLVAGGGIDTRYSRARIRIPAGTAWTYVSALEPDIANTGTY